jgi:hypothetical protein
MAMRRVVVRCAAWPFAAASALVATTAFAASLSVSSKNLTPFRTCVITGTPKTTTAESDSEVKQDNATANFAGTTPLDIQSSTSKNHREYVSFALTTCAPAIPSSATVKSATLRMYVTTLGAACRTFDAFRVTSSWADTTITWNNQPFGTTLNNPASAQATSSISIGPSVCTNTATGYLTTAWNVTTDVQAFVSGTATNNGWMIRDDVENASTAAVTKFADSATNVVGQSLQLVVTYTT